MRMSRTLVGRLRAPALPALADTGISSVRPARPRCVAPGVPELALRYDRARCPAAISVSPSLLHTITVVAVNYRVSCGEDA